MRYVFQDPAKQSYGPSTIEKFLWFPHVLKNSQGKWEFRWFERARINRKLKPVERTTSCGWGTYPTGEYYWEWISWAN